MTKDEAVLFLGLLALDTEGINSWAPPEAWALGKKLNDEFGPFIENQWNGESTVEVDRFKKMLEYDPNITQ